MSSAWLSASIQEFEQVSLDNGTELFRVRARAQGGEDPEPRPVLVTRAPDGAAHTYEPLSSGGDRRGLLRLAYAVGTELVGPATAFALQLPDGYRIELPQPTAGERRAEHEHEHEPRLHDAGPRPPGGEIPASPELIHGADDDGPHSTQDAVAEALSERDDAIRALESALAERDAARADAHSAAAERDAALEATREALGEHARLTARLRQHEARIELLRADARHAAPGTDPRLRRLESEREQLATHVRALAELLAVNGRPDQATAVQGPAEPAAAGSADRLATLRAGAVRDAEEQAERELRRLRADARH